MRDFMKNCDIIFETSAPYTHEQNGTAERDINNSRVRKDDANREWIIEKSMG